MNLLRSLKPFVFFESPVLGFINKFRLTGIAATGFSFGPFIFFSKKIEDVPESSIRHETIHFFQQLEMLFVFQWILYAFFYAVGYYRSGRTRFAYLSNPFELEAYDNQDKKDYVQNRKWFSWVDYVNLDKVSKKEAQ